MVKKLFSATTLLLFSFFSIQAQVLPVGAEAPDLHIIKWLKGKPVTSFEKGKVYIVEFSFVGCKPCRETIPHLSEWSRKYRKDNKVQVVSVYTAESNPEKPADLSYIKLIQRLLDYMGNKMDYTVAVDVPKQETRKAWGNINAYPTLYIVNQEGKIAFNHTGNADEITFALESIVNSGQFDPEAFREKSKEKITADHYWQAFEDELEKLLDEANGEKALRKIDSALSRVPDDKKENLLLAKFTTYLYMGDSATADQYLQVLMEQKHIDWEGLHHYLYNLALKRYYAPAFNYQRYLAIADSAIAEVGIPGQVMEFILKANVVYSYTHNKAKALAPLRQALNVMNKNASLKWIEACHQEIEKIERWDKETKLADADWQKLQDTIAYLGSVDLSKIDQDKGNVAQHRFISESRKKQAAMAEDFWIKYPGDRRRYDALNNIFLKANMATVPFIGNMSPELEKQLNAEVNVLNEDRVKYPNKELRKYASAYFRMFPIDLKARAEWIRKGDTMVNEIVSNPGSPTYIRESFAWALFSRDWRAAAVFAQHMPDRNERADDNITSLEGDFWKGAIDQYWQSMWIRFNLHVEKYADLPAIQYRAADFLSGTSMLFPELAMDYWQKIIDTYGNPSHPLAQKTGVKALVKRAHEQLYILKIEEGKAPVDMKFTALDGREIDLANYRGKVVLIDFWASWCKPCVGEMPALKAIYDKYHDKGFEMIGICMDEEDKRDEVKKLLAKNSLIGPQRFEGQGFDGDQYKQLYGIVGLPTAWLLDKEGKLVSTSARGEALEELLRKYLE